MHVDRYEPLMAADWDAFVRSSRNGTFLFERGYIEYHADRFRDHSLVVRHEDEWLAVLPAHATNNRIASHDGLSYGGLVIAPRMKAPIFLRVFEAVFLHLQQAGFTTLDYKTVPHIYHRQPAEDDRYALFRVGAELIRRDVLSVVSLADRLPYQHRRAARDQEGENGRNHRSSGGRSSRLLVASGCNVGRAIRCRAGAHA